jgi:hypothetical protein
MKLNSVLSVFLCVLAIAVSSNFQVAHSAELSAQDSSCSQISDQDSKATRAVGSTAEPAPEQSTLPATGSPATATPGQ